MVARVEVALRVGAQLGEGPRWDRATARLLWVDIEGRAVHVWDARSREDRAIAVWSRVGCASWTDRDDVVLVGLAERLALLDLRDESLATLVEIPHAGHMRLNDGACDPRGRFWVGSMALDESRDLAALYRYADGVLDRVVERVSLSNGLGWSPDATLMYYVDSLTQRIDVFDYDVDSGAISGRRAFATIAARDGIPDGIAVDDDGGVWVALWGGRSVRRYSPAGELVSVVDVPAENVTACCFGGDDRRSLFVTTAAPAGDVYVVDAGVTGAAATPFALGRSGAPSDADPTSAR
jgi:sugar lactone lactonase YvrE